MTQIRQPAHRVVLCRGQFCNFDRRADILYKRLNEAVAEANAAQPSNPPCFGLRTANCLSMCGAGPNLVIYPEDAVFNRVDLTSLEQIIDEHIKQRQEL
jgi:(2Fe-2S) ferredoxin